MLRALTLLTLLSGCGPAPWKFDHLRNEFSISVSGGDTKATVEKHPNGLADAFLSVETGERRIILYGFEFYDLDRHRIVPDEVLFTVKGKTLIVEHRFDPGRVVTATLSLDKTGLLTCRFDRLDRIGHVASGRLDARFDEIRFDSGWVFKRPAPFQRSRVMSDCLFGSDPESGHMLIACDQGKTVLINPGARRYGWQTRHRPPAATFVLGIDDKLERLVARYKAFRKHRPGPYAAKLVGRLLIDDWSSFQFDYITSLFEALRFANADRLVAVRHLWQRYGYDVKLPDTYPPNDAYGGLKAMKTLADYCRRTGILLALHENFFDLYEDAPSYAKFVPARQPREWTGGVTALYTGWLNPDTGKRARVHTPRSSLSAMKRNLTLQAENLHPSAAFLDVTSYSDPLALDLEPPKSGSTVTAHPAPTMADTSPTSPPSSQPASTESVPTQSDPPPQDSLTVLRELYAGAAKIVQGPVLGEGCTEKFLGVVDGANLDLWAQNRWDNDPGVEDWDFSPVLAWVAHESVVFHGAGYRHRYGRSQQVPLSPEMYRPPFTDDYQSTVILFGSAPASLIADHPYSTQVSRILQDYFLGVPFHRHIGLVPITNVVHPDGNLHRSVVTYANGTTVYVNRSPKAWQVESYTLPQFGYVVEDEAFTQLAILHEGHRLDLVLSPEVCYVDTRGQQRVFAGMTFTGCLAITLFADRCEVVPIADVESIRLNFADFLIPADQIDRIEVVVPDGTASALVSDRRDELDVPADALRIENDPDALFAWPYNKIVIRRKHPRSKEERFPWPSLPARPTTPSIGF